MTAVEVPVPGVGLVLRAFRVDDLPDLLAAFADPLVRTWNPGPGDEDAVVGGRRWMDERNDWSDGTHASWAVSGPDGRLLGSVSLHKIDHAQRDGEVGYWLAPWARGRGWGARAVDAAARFGFAHLDLHRLHLFHAVQNVRSCRLAAAAGFALEGRLRQSYRLAEGNYHDEHLHGRLADDRPPFQPQPPAQPG